MTGAEFSVLLWHAVEPDWEVLASLNYVDASQSPSWLARALYIPWLSARRNKHVKYVLLRRM